MSYNKARAEKEWLENKNKEETELRCLNFNEEKIAKLHKADWEMFNSERRYQERSTNIESCDLIVADEPFIEVHNIQELLDSIDNPKLHSVLLSVDMITLQIAVYKINGYHPNEIACILQLTDKAVYRRLDRLKEKIKKVL